MNDPAIVEAAAKAIGQTDEDNNWEEISFDHRDWYRELAMCVLVKVTPMIEAAALERAAQAFEPDEDGHDAHNYRWKVEEIAAAIRALITVNGN